MIYLKFSVIMYQVLPKMELLSLLICLVSKLPPKLLSITRHQVLSKDWKFTTNKQNYALQTAVDYGENVLNRFWATALLKFNSLSIWWERNNSIFYPLCSVAIFIFLKSQTDQYITVLKSDTSAWSGTESKHFSRHKRLLKIYCASNSEAVFCSSTPPILCSHSTT